MPIVNKIFIWLAVLRLALYAVLLVLSVSFPGKADQAHYLFATTFFLYVSVYLYYAFLKIVSSKDKVKPKNAKYGVIILIICILIDAAYIIIMN